MTWKLKEEFKNQIVTNFRKPLSKLKKHQIESLPKKTREKYFEEKKEVKKSIKKQTDEVEVKETYAGGIS